MLLVEESIGEDKMHVVFWRRDERELNARKDIYKINRQIESYKIVIYFIVRRQTYHIDIITWHVGIKL